MDEQRYSTFEMRWGYILLGFLFGLFAVIGTALLAGEARRDKIHSSLLGCAITLALNFIYFTFLQE